MSSKTNRDKELIIKICSCDRWIIVDPSDPLYERIQTLYNQVDESTFDVRLREESMCENLSISIVITEQITHWLPK